MMDVVKRALPFLLTLIVGVFLGSLFRSAVTGESYLIKLQNGFNDSEYSYGHRRYDSGCRSQKYRSKGFPVEIHSKPLPVYTERARANDFEGTVRLEVEFKMNGQIGEIKILDAQPYSLTEEAIKAARQITFRPALENGRYITTTKILEYNFSPSSRL